MEHQCEGCLKIFASRRSLYNHQTQNRCQEMPLERTDSMEVKPKRGVGRPKKLVLERTDSMEVQPILKTAGTKRRHEEEEEEESSRYEVSSHASTSDVEEDMFDNRSQKYQRLSTTPSVKFKEKMPDWMKEPFERAKGMISRGVCKKIVYFIILFLT